MTKYFCDHCNKEMKSIETGYSWSKNGPMSVQFRVHIGVSGLQNDIVMVCDDCQLKNCYYMLKEKMIEQGFLEK